MGEGGQRTSWQGLGIEIATPEAIRRFQGAQEARPAAVIASGPSLRQLRPEWVSDCWRIVVNAGLIWCPEADLHVCADANFYRDFPEITSSFAGRKIYLPPDCLLWEDAGGLHLEATKGRLYCNGSSAQAALHLALLSGASPVILLGVDLSTEGGDYFWGNRPRTNVATSLGRMAGMFELIAKYAGDRVLNGSPGSRLTCFEKVDLSDVAQRNRQHPQSPDDH